MITLRRYYIMLCINFFLLLLDLFLNAVENFLYHAPVKLLLLYILQDVCIIFAIISVILSFFSTYVFQAGFIELLYDRFRLTIIIAVLYLFLSISLHVWVLISCWNHLLSIHWGNGLLAVFVINRVVAVFHYYFYKRSILRISDPRFYEDFGLVCEKL